MEKGEKRKVKPGLEASVNFYRISRKLNWLQEVSSAGVEGEHQFYFFMEEDKAALLAKNIPLHILAYDEVSGTWLAKTEKPKGKSIW